MRAPTLPHRWVMNVWSNGAETPWHTRNDHLFQAHYRQDLLATCDRRECTDEELVDIVRECSQWGAA